MAVTLFPFSRFQSSRSLFLEASYPRRCRSIPLPKIQLALLDAVRLRLRHAPSLDAMADVVRLDATAVAAFLAVAEDAAPEGARRSVVLTLVGRLNVLMAVVIQGQAPTRTVAQSRELSVLRESEACLLQGRSTRYPRIHSNRRWGSSDEILKATSLRLALSTLWINS